MERAKADAEKLLSVWWAMCESDKNTEIYFYPTEVVAIHSRIVTYKGNAVEFHKNGEVETLTLKSGLITDFCWEFIEKLRCGILQSDEHVLYRVNTLYDNMTHKWFFNVMDAMCRNYATKLI